MLDADTIADIEGDASALLRAAGMDEDEPTDMRRLCVAMTGRAPEIASLRSEGATWDGRVFVRRGLAPARMRWLVGHELAEIHYERVGYRGADVERRCDALGAALAVPRRAYLRALGIVGASARALAKALGTTESIAILRDGETRGRPVSVVRAAGAIVRGEPFVWPVRLELQAARRARHPAVMRASIKDEPDRVGLRAA